MPEIIAIEDGWRTRPCRVAIIEAIERLESGVERTVFEYSEIVKAVLAATSDWPESTIKTMIMSTMCVDSDAHQYEDLDRVDRGRYRLRDERAPWRREVGSSR